MPALFVLPFVTLEACACSPGSPCEDRSDVVVRVQLEPTGYDLILGRVSVEAESRRPLYGTTAALDSRAQRFFDDRREPMYILLKIPMLAIAGAAAFFVRGWPGEAVRGVAAAVGLALVIRLTGIVQADITRQIEEFGREL